MLLRFAGAVLALSWSLGGSAQETRGGEIQQQRQEKAAVLRPDTPPLVERVIRYVTTQEALRQTSHEIPGLGVRLGGLVSGSGFALGPEYSRRGLRHGNVLFRTSARISYKLYQRYDMQLTFPHLADDHALLDFSAVGRNYPSLNYYGPGPNSKKTGRSDYLIEDGAFDGKVALKPFAGLRAGMTGGYVIVNSGPGRDERFASTDRIYTAATTPGLDFQSNFLRAGPFADFDYRDHPGNPHRGGLYRASYLYFLDRDSGTFDFRRLTAEVQQYVSGFHDTHVIAIRGKTELSYTDPGRAVPFYLQPILGGLDDLRGFRPFRFYDDNLIALNGEYRWAIFTGLDGVLFLDEGKVFHSHSEFNLHRLEQSYGFGFRFSTAESVFMRIETGFSREGFQIWVKFGDVF